MAPLHSMLCDMSTGRTAEGESERVQSAPSPAVVHQEGKTLEAMGTLFVHFPGRPRVRPPSTRQASGHSCGHFRGNCAGLRKSEAPSETARVLFRGRMLRRSRLRTPMLRRAPGHGRTRSARVTATATSAAATGVSRLVACAPVACATQPHATSTVSPICGGTSRPMGGLDGLLPGVRGPGSQSSRRLPFGIGGLEPSAERNVAGRTDCARLAARRKSAV
mmetsp:Transcript_76255/g.220210  ORF Transcript_76255/g.220210 Transcript_76255/m.220210 type:complete len:220 (-) Transcript_76255:920-1579(-)